MLNPFPILLSYGGLAPFILRVVAGIIFFDLGLFLFKGERGRWIISLSILKIPKPKIAVKVLGIIEIVGGLMFIFGFYTQIASVALSLLTFSEAYVEYKDPGVLKRSLVFYSLLFAITLSLLFSGAGKFAIDIPL